MSNHTAHFCEVAVMERTWIEGLLPGGNRIGIVEIILDLKRDG